MEINRSALLLMSATLLVALGCSSGSDMGTIEGQVTLDGKPLVKGAVRLSPIDGQAQTAGAAIQAGKFTVRARPANYRVEISATEVRGSTGGRINKLQDNLNVVSLIPERYNTNSELKLEVKPGLNEKSFELTSR
jgi:hypothetical protein